MSSPVNTAKYVWCAVATSSFEAYPFLKSKFCADNSQNINFLEHASLLYLFWHKSVFKFFFKHKDKYGLLVLGENRDAFLSLFQQKQRLWGLSLFSSTSDLLKATLSARMWNGSIWQAECQCQSLTWVCKGRLITSTLSHPLNLQYHLASFIVQTNIKSTLLC